PPAGGVGLGSTTRTVASTSLSSSTSWLRLLKIAAVTSSLRGLRNRPATRASKRESRQVLFATGETADEYTRRLATTPRLLRHPDRPRTIARPAHRRRRVVAHPSVRRTDRTHPGPRRQPEEWGDLFVRASLDAAEFVLGLEGRFGVELPDAAFALF